MRSLILSFTVLGALAVTPAMAQMAGPPNGPPVAGPATPGPAYPPGQPGADMNYNGNAGMAGQGPGIVGMVPAPPSHQPMVRHPTNINASDSRSIISPSLPQPPVGPNADATQYLQAAQRALMRGRGGEAQAALENAETWLLNRSVPAGAVNQPDQNPAVTNISSALQALAAGNRAQAMNLVQQTIPMTMQAQNGPGMMGPGMNGPGMAGPGMGGPQGMMNGNPPPPPPPGTNP